MSSCFLAFNPANPELYDKICYPNDTSFFTNFSQEVKTTDSIPFFNNFSNSFDINAVWILITAIFVFFLQTGYMFIQSSFVKPNHIQQTLAKNLLGICICGIVFYVVGYSMAFGRSGSYADKNRFMGMNNILIEDNTDTSWFFEFMYLAVSLTIASNSISHRSSTTAYFIFVVCFSAWIYPVIAYWCWSTTGWISPYSVHPRPFGGLMDFSGSGVVHLLGGFCGSCGAMVLGTRPHRFLSDSNRDSKQFREVQREYLFGYNVIFQVFGTIFLWFGWYGFTCGRTLGATNVMQIASKVAVVTTLSAGTAGLVTVTIVRIVEGYWSLIRLCDGILCGLVAICSACNVIDCGYGMLIGFSVSLCYYVGYWILVLLKIDDPMNSFLIHSVSGGYGLLAAGLFSTPDSIRFGYSAYDVPRLIEATKGHRFATQIAGMVVISTWASINSFLIFGIMRLVGILKAPNIDVDNKSGNVEEGSEMEQIIRRQNT